MAISAWSLASSASSSSSAALDLPLTVDKNTTQTQAVISVLVIIGRDGMMGGEQTKKGRQKEKRGGEVRWGEREETY